MQPFPSVEEHSPDIVTSYTPGAYPKLDIISAALKVHKKENFFGSDFEFCIFSLLDKLKD